ncbi:histidine--tRNA ligase [Carboxydochorda subterranea]|uniref:Histidine--tRNA ligase n=1 Tax=Carboxydichorda subterranea TaxID=3109565 RepID=A0ABZ1C0J2_9FIRM|nr:histidine--tRNA ligase [Limnochorda sp. L945t]WRP18301.1 histidine--tRNA ligase [Limnochorda sp. L945t]
MATVKAPRGTEDVLPGRSEQWSRLEAVTREVMASYGYREIRTPVFEHTELFVRGAGEATDVVEKEMYTFADRSGRSITLRPEGTAPVARAYIEHGMKLWPQPVKLFYIGPMFRYERPQAGRLRQHYQIGAEALGCGDPALDAEAILLPIELFRRLGLSGFSVHLNSIGCPRCRPAYRERLLEYLRPRAAQLCESCQRRLERSPLRVLDCKVPTCRAVTEAAPRSFDYLCDDCRVHFETLQGHLGALGVSYTLDPRLVRGFDYYTRTVFEVLSDQLGAQNALAGGGRYDGLVESLGGPPTPGVGFASGMERAMLAASSAGKAGGIEDGRAGWIDVYVASAAPARRREALLVTRRLREQGWRVETDYEGRSLRAQLRWADRAGARVAVIVGEEETSEPGDPMVVRHLARGEQQRADDAQVVALVGRWLA